MIGVVLAGGQSKRMGADKALVEVAGRPMIEWVAEALARAFGEVVVSGRRDGHGHPTLPDPDPAGQGPLAGLVAAMDAFPDEPVALVAVDQPWVRARTVGRLGALVDDLAAVPVEAGVRQTTCAVYPPGLRDLATSELTEGGSLQSLLDVAAFQPVVDWQAWGEDGRSWYSADTPEAIARGLDRFGPPPG